MDYASDRNINALATPCPENVDQKNSHHVERKGLSRTSSVVPRSGSMGEESDDCWVHMLEYNPPR